MEFLAENNETVPRLFRVGMLPGRYLAHLLVSRKILTNPDVLLATALATNLFAAIFATAAYLSVRRRKSAASS